MAPNSSIQRLPGDPKFCELRVFGVVLDQRGRAAVCLVCLEPGMLKQLACEHALRTAASGGWPIAALRR